MKQSIFSRTASLRPSYSSLKPHPSSLLLVFALAAFANISPAFPQSPVFTSWLPPAGISKERLVGFQQTGFGIGYVSPGGRNWASILDAGQPGYRARIGQRMRAASSRHATDSVSDLVVDSQWVVIQSDGKCLLAPEGAFATSLANHLRPAEGDVLTRVPLSYFVEREGEVEDEAGTVSIRIQSRSVSQLRSVSKSKAHSVSQLLGQLDSIPPWILIERVEPVLGQVSLLIPAWISENEGSDSSHEMNQEEEYYDAFHAIPIQHGDRIQLLDDVYLPLVLKSWNQGSSNAGITPTPSSIHIPICHRIKPRNTRSTRK